MHKNVKSVLAKALAVTLAFTMVGVAAPDSDAAKKPKLSKTKVTVKVKKSAKVTIKNVKAKKVKKLTVKVDKKKIASVKKNGKTAFTIKGIKAGKANVTAKVKVGSKVTTLKVKVTVKKADVVPTAAPSASAPAASTAPKATATPVATPVVTPSATPVVSSTPTPEPKATPLISYSENFDNDLGDWYIRFNDEDNPAAGLNTRLELSDEAHSGKAMLVADRLKSWNSPTLDLTDCITEGGTYKVSFWAKVPVADEDFEDGIDLRISGGNKMEEDAEEKYENYPADTNYPIYADKWTHIETTFTVPSALYSYIFYIESNGSGKASFLIDDFTLERTNAPREFDPSLASIKDTYAKYIDTVGTAVSYDQLLNKNVLGFVKHHYNSITLGNALKPDAVLGTKKVIKTSDEKAADYFTTDAYNACESNKDADGDVVVPEIDFTSIDKILKVAKDNGLKLRYHTFIWHQQMPKHFFTVGYSNEDDATFVDQATMFTREEMYIKSVLNHILSGEYKDVVYAVDVVNEYYHMSNESPQAPNFWKEMFGTEMKTDCEYVKKAFSYAYEALKANNKQNDISLFYNDYNTYDNPEKEIEIINNINKKDDINVNGDKFCAGIGMQAHIADTNANVERFAAALDAFVKAGLEIQITELDVTNCGKVTAETSAEDKADVEAACAEMYKGIMNAILKAKVTDNGNITSVTIWGVTDATSWREDASPVLFGSDVADKKPAFDAVIDAALNFGK